MPIINSSSGQLELGFVEVGVGDTVSFGLLWPDGGYPAMPAARAKTGGFFSM